jgi:hypothetical protein
MRYVSGTSKVLLSILASLLSGCAATVVDKAVDGQQAFLAEATLSTQFILVGGEVEVEARISEATDGSILLGFEAVGGTSELELVSNDYDSVAALYRLRLRGTAAGSAVQVILSSSTHEISSNELSLQVLDAAGVGPVITWRPRNVTGSEIRADIHFPYKVTGLEMGDFSISGGTLVELTGADQDYVLLVNPENASDDVSLSLNVSAAVDLFGRSTLASGPHDLRAPSVSLVYPEIPGKNYDLTSILGYAGPTQNLEVTGTCSVGTQVVLGFEWSPASTLSTACDSSGEWSLSAALPGSPASLEPLSLSVYAQDSAGHRSALASGVAYYAAAGPSVYRGSTIDTYDPLNAAERGSYDVSGTCAPIMSTVQISLVSDQRTHLTVSMPCGSDGSWLLSARNLVVEATELSSANTNVRFVASVQDWFGNDAVQATQSLTNELPEELVLAASMDTPRVGQVFGVSEASIRITCELAGQGVTRDVLVSIFGVRTGVILPATCLNGEVVLNFSAPGYLSGPNADDDGSYSVQVTPVVNCAGGGCQAYTSFRLDNVNDYVTETETYDYWPSGTTAPDQSCVQGSNVTDTYARYDDGNRNLQGSTTNYSQYSCSCRSEFFTNEYSTLSGTNAAGCTFTRSSTSWSYTGYMSSSNPGICESITGDTTYTTFTISDGEAYPSDATSPGVCTADGMTIEALNVVLSGPQSGSVPLVATPRGGGYLYDSAYMTLTGDGSNVSGLSSVVVSCLSGACVLTYDYDGSGSSGASQTLGTNTSWRDSQGNFYSTPISVNFTVE